MVKFQDRKSLHQFCLVEGFEYKCKHNIFKCFHLNIVLNRLEMQNCYGLSCSMYNKYMGGLTSTIVNVCTLHFTFVHIIINSNFTKIHVAFGMTANCASKIKCKRTIALKPTELIFNESIRDCWLNQNHFKFHCCLFHLAVAMWWTVHFEWCWRRRRFTAYGRLLNISFRLC